MNDMVATAPIRTHEKETGALPLIVAMTANSMKGDEAAPLARQAAPCAPGTDKGGALHRRQSRGKELAQTPRPAVETHSVEYRNFLQ